MSQLCVLKRKDIDEQKWNTLIQASVPSLPYALTYYLDAVAENWDAVVVNDYEAAMPLVWLRKLGIKCLYQPYYCQQLGIFSKQNLSKQAIKQILLAAQRFSYININLNSSAKIIAEELSLKNKKNLLLDLSKDYSVIRKNYAENHKRNISKAEKYNLVFKEDVEIKQFQNFYLENVNRTKEKFKPQHEKVFKQLTKVLAANGTANIFAAANGQEKLVAAVLLVRHQNRLVSIINSSSSDGKNSGASHFLFDKIIQKFSNQANAVLDFEGSSVSTIARFYEGFGAAEEIFYNYQNSIISKGRQRFL